MPSEWAQIGRHANNRRLVSCPGMGTEGRRKGGGGPCAVYSKLNALSVALSAKNLGDIVNNKIAQLKFTHNMAAAWLLVPENF